MNPKGEFSKITPQAELLSNVIGKYFTWFKGTLLSETKQRVFECGIYTPTTSNSKGGIIIGVKFSFHFRHSNAFKHAS